MYVDPYFSYCIEICVAAAVDAFTADNQITKTGSKINKFFKVIRTFSSSISEF